MSTPIIHIRSNKREIKEFFGMVVFLGIVTSGIVAFTVVKQKPENEKLYEVKLPLPTWIRNDNGMEYIKKRLQESDIPAKEVKFMIDSILTYSQTLISSQLNPVLQKEQKLSDSLNKKPKQ